MNDHPIEANGMGGCSERYLGRWKGTGQIFDHHFVEFTYKDGTKLYSQCRHQAHTFENVSEHAIGATGRSGRGGVCDLSGESRRSRRQRRPQGNFHPGGPYVQEHVDLIAAIKNSAKYHEGWYGATSSFTAVLGRTATYSGQVVKWDDLVAKGKSDFPKQLAWDAPAPVQKDADGNYPIPMPGVYQAY